MNGLRNFKHECLFEGEMFVTEHQGIFSMAEVQPVIGYEWRKCMVLKKGWQIMKGSCVPISHVLNGKGTLLPCLPFYQGNGTRYGSLDDYPTSFV